MEDYFFQIYFNDIIGRSEGIMHFRLISQPLSAIYFAIRGGLRDSKENRPPFFWALVFHPEHHQDLLKSSYKDIGKVITAAFLFDTAYQILVFHFFYPIQAMIVAITLALVPYLVFRAQVTRLANIIKKIKS
jgi:hypothetical protein